MVSSLPLALVALVASSTALVSNIGVGVGVGRRLASTSVDVTDLGVDLDQLAAPRLPRACR